MKMEFTTIEVARILGVNRVAFHEWCIQGYLSPIRNSKRRGSSAIFDIHGVIAAAIFNTLRGKIRRKECGQVSKWYQDGGYNTSSKQIYYVVNNGKGTVQDYPATSSHNYAIVIELATTRHWIATRIHEELKHGQVASD
jgi:hypothetical protein